MNVSKLADESPLEKAYRLLDEIEASVVVDESDPVAKANAALEKALRRDEPIDVLAAVEPHMLRELAQRLNVDPDGPNALAELGKIAGARPYFVESFLAEPLPPKCLGAGAAFAMSTEKLETMAKARGYGMSEAEWKRGLA
jgi:hypothetical protein